MAIKLKAKNGLIIEFKMSSEDKKKALVNKFVLGSVKQSTLLKLGKYGSIQVEDILDLEYETQIPETKTTTLNIEDLFGANIPSNFKNF